MEGPTTLLCFLDTHATGDVFGKTRMHVVALMHLDYQLRCLWRFAHLYAPPEGSGRRLQCRPALAVEAMYLRLRPQLRGLATLPKLGGNMGEWELEGRERPTYCVACWSFNNVLYQSYPVGPAFCSAQIGLQPMADLGVNLTRMSHSGLSLNLISRTAARIPTRFK